MTELNAKSNAEIGVLRKSCDKIVDNMRGIKSSIILAALLLSKAEANVSTTINLMACQNPIGQAYTAGQSYIMNNTQFAVYSSTNCSGPLTTLPVQSTGSLNLSALWIFNLLLLRYIWCAIIGRRTELIQEGELHQKQHKFSIPSIE